MWCEVAGLTTDGKIPGIYYPGNRYDLKRSWVSKRVSTKTTLKPQPPVTSNVAAEMALQLSSLETAPLGPKGCGCQRWPRPYRSCAHEPSLTRTWSLSVRDAVILTAKHNTPTHKLQWGIEACWDLKHTHTLLLCFLFRSRGSALGYFAMWMQERSEDSHLENKE